MPTMKDWEDDGWRWKTTRLYNGIPFHPNCECIRGGGCDAGTYCTCDVNPSGPGAMTIVEYYNRYQCQNHRGGIPPMRNAEPTAKELYSIEYLENEFPNDAAALRKMGLNRNSQWYRDALLKRR